MKIYLLDIYTERNELLLQKLLREATSNSTDELGRLEWQINNSDTDILMSDLLAIAIYTPSMETIDKYEDGIAFYSGDELLDKISKLMLITYNNNYTFAGWGIKSYVVPALYKAYLMGGLDIGILDSIFNVYPFENKNTIDLNNMYNFNGQMSTVRARNRYALEETAYAYGETSALDDLGEFRSPEKILRERIRLQKYLFELRGLSWV